jgi:hypothetical protein
VLDLPAGDERDECQHLECDLDATFQIINPAAVHAETQDAFACTAHVGELVGHHESDPEPGHYLLFAL